MKKILLVDDSSFMRKILRELLTNNTIIPSEIYEADSKETALQQIKNIRPHLVLLDIVMRDNEIEGVETLADIKHSYPALHVIMVSSIGQVSILEQCQTLGAIDHIQKPFDKNEVLNLVNKYIT